MKHIFLILSTFLFVVNINAQALKICTGSGGGSNPPSSSISANDSNVIDNQNCDGTQTIDLSQLVTANCTTGSVTYAIVGNNNGTSSISGSTVTFMVTGGTGSGSVSYQASCPDGTNATGIINFQCGAPSSTILAADYTVSDNTNCTGTQTIDLDLLITNNCVSSNYSVVTLNVVNGTANIDANNILTYMITSGSTTGYVDYRAQCQDGTFADGRVNFECDAPSSSISANDDIVSETATCNGTQTRDLSQLVTANCTTGSVSYTVISATGGTTNITGSSLEFVHTNGSGSGSVTYQASCPDGTNDTGTIDFVCSANSLTCNTNFPFYLEEELDCTTGDLKICFTTCGDSNPEGIQNAIGFDETQWQFIGAADYAYPTETGVFSNNAPGQLDLVYSVISPKIIPDGTVLYCAYFSQLTGGSMSVGMVNGQNTNVIINQDLSQSSYMMQDITIDCSGGPSSGVIANDATVGDMMSCDGTQDIDLSTTTNATCISGGSLIYSIVNQSNGTASLAGSVLTFTHTNSSGSGSVTYQASCPDGTNDTGIITFNCDMDTTVPAFTASIETNCSANTVTYCLATNNFVTTEIYTHQLQYDPNFLSPNTNSVTNNAAALNPAAFTQPPDELNIQFFDSSGGTTFPDGSYAYCITFDIIAPLPTAGTIIRRYPEAERGPSPPDQILVDGVEYNDTGTTLEYVWNNQDLTVTCP